MASHRDPLQGQAPDRLPLDLSGAYTTGCRVAYRTGKNTMVTHPKTV